MKTLAARLGLLAFAGVMGGGPLMRAADDVPAADDAVPHAREIRQLTERMGWRQKTQQAFSRDFQEMGDFIKSDLQLVTAEYEGFIDGFQKAIDAYRQGEVETARGLAKEAEKARESREWGRRFQARREQSQNWPDEKWADEMQTKWGGARTKAFGAEWVQSRRRASAAWGRYAESIAPGVERQQQLALEDAAFLAEAGVRSTEERWRIRQMNDRDWLEGEVREFTPQGVVLGSVLFGAKTVRWSDHPAAVVLGGRTDSAAWELLLKDGSQIRARAFSVEGERGVARTAAVAEIAFLVAELLEIRAVNTNAAAKP